MGYRYGHTGGEVPITLGPEEERATAVCPTCTKLEFEGHIEINVPLDQAEGSLPAKCSRGHLVFVRWQRAAASDS